MNIIKAPHHFKGGIHPTYHKHLSAGVAIRDMPVAPLLRVSMAQHLGAPATPCVKKGDEVARGQISLLQFCFCAVFHKLVIFHNLSSDKTTLEIRMDCASSYRGR